MRILHTSDLHLGGTWERQDRKVDEQRVIGEILELCNQYAVDLLLITGDVFTDERPHLRMSVARRFFQQLAPAMRRGMRLVLLRGNHDDLEFFRLLRYVCQEWLDGQGSTPVIADVPDVYEVPESDLQIIALPYLTPSMLEQNAADASVDADQRVVGLSGLLSQRLLALYRNAKSDRRAIFVGHVSVRGAHITKGFEYQSGYNHELWITADALPQFTCYNALGHIHLSQQITSAGKPTWYAGSPDRHNLGEREYSPQILLIDLPDRPGGVADVRPIPIARCTPFEDLALDTPQEVRTFCERVRDTNPLGKVALNVAFADRAECEDEIRRAAPRLNITFATRMDTSIEVMDDFDPYDVAGTVRDFIERSYTDAEKKARLLTGFARLWEEVKS